MPDKEKEAFRTIGEVAAELELPQHVLRFWETKFPQVRPMKRGGGRRFYRPADLELLRAIRHLLYSKGFTIRGVQRLLKEQGARSLAETMRSGAGGEPTLAFVRPEAAPWTQTLVDEDGASSRVPAEIGRIEPALEADLQEPAAGQGLPVVEVQAEAPIREASPKADAKLQPERLTGAKGDFPSSARSVLNEVLVELLDCKRRLDQLR